MKTPSDRVIEDIEGAEIPSEDLGAFEEDALTKEDAEDAKE